MQYSLLSQVKTIHGESIKKLYTKIVTETLTDFYLYLVNITLNKGCKYERV